MYWPVYLTTGLAVQSAVSLSPNHWQILRRKWLVIICVTIGCSQKLHQRTEQWLRLSLDTSKFRWEVKQGCSGIKTFIKSNKGLTQCLMREPLLNIGQFSRRTLSLTTLFYYYHYIPEWRLLYASLLQAPSCGAQRILHCRAHTVGNKIQIFFISFISVGHCILMNKRQENAKYSAVVTCHAWLSLKFIPHTLYRQWHKFGFLVR